MNEVFDVPLQRTVTLIQPLSRFKTPKLLLSRIFQKRSKSLSNVITESS